MAGGISDETFWTVITLFFLRVEFGSGGTSNTIFAVPKREVGRAVASVIGFVVYSGSSFSIWSAFANIGSTDNSWGFAGDFAITSLRLFVIDVVSWTGDTS